LSVQTLEGKSKRFNLSILFGSKFYPQPVKIRAQNYVNKTDSQNERLAVAQNPVFCQIAFGAFYHQDVVKLSPI